MDINQLDSLLNYKIDLSVEPQTLVDKIISIAEKYLDKSCKQEIQKAYKYADKAHTWQTRLSWEKYIIHPIQATLILMDLKPDIKSIQTCLLHDVIEDTDITYWIPENDFPFYYEMISMKNSMKKSQKYFFMLPNHRIAFPMQTVERNTLREERLSYSVVEIKKGPIGDTLFRIPSNYILND